MMKIILWRWVYTVVFFCFTQVVLAKSHHIGVLGEEIYRDSQIFSNTDVLNERNESYGEVLTALKSSIDEDLLDKILDEVEVYAHYYSFTPDFDGFVRVCEYSNLTAVPDKLHRIHPKLLPLMPD
jgi:hypothetical protein